MRIFFLILVISYCPLLSVAQKQPLDSLLGLLKNAGEDSSKVRLLLKIGDQYENSEPSVARTWYSKAGNLSRKIGYYKGISWYYTYYSGTFMVEGKLDSMSYYSEQGLAFARQIKDSLEIGIALFNIGQVYREKGEYEKAIDYCLQGRTLADGRGDLGIQTKLDDALQILYAARTNYDKAIEYGEQAVKQARALKAKPLLTATLINLSMSYIQKLNLEKGNALLKEALDLSKELQDIRMEATVLLNLADISLKRRDIGTITPYVQRSLDIYRQIGSADGETIALRALAIPPLQEKNYTRARELALQAMALDRKNGYIRELASITRLLAIIEYAAGDTKQGLEYDDESNTLLEKLVKDVLSEQSSNLEKKYETEKKEVKIKQLEAEKAVQKLSIRQKNTLNYALIGGAATLLIILLLVYRNYTQKQKLQLQRISELEMEKKLAATEAVLKGEEQERTRLAKDLHDGLGGLLSGIKYSFNSMKGNLVMTPDNAQAFERSMDMLDSSIREMRRVAHNMMPEALVKFGLDTALKDFCNDIDKSGALKLSYQSVGIENMAIEQTTAITIYRIAQELVNNIIKHAAAKTAIVQLTKTDGQLALTVEDDGNGFDTAILRPTQVQGIGWSNIRNRVDFLKGTLDVQSTAGKGTSVMIEFNI